LATTSLEEYERTKLRRKSQPENRETVRPVANPIGKTARVAYGDRARHQKGKEREKRPEGREKTKTTGGGKGKGKER